jgi:hypothetical protein
LINGQGVFTSLFGGRIKAPPLNGGFGRLGACMAELFFFIHK